YGEVVSVALPTDRETGRPRGFGFVEMADDAARKAIAALNGKDFGGRALNVNEAKPREAGSGFGGGGGGRRSYGGGGGGGYGAGCARGAAVMSRGRGGPPYRAPNERELLLTRHCGRPRSTARERRDYRTDARTATDDPGRACGPRRERQGTDWLGQDARLWLAA